MCVCVCKVYLSCRYYFESSIIVIGTLWNSFRMSYINQMSWLKRKTVSCWLGEREIPNLFTKSNTHTIFNRQKCTQQTRKMLSRFDYVIKTTKSQEKKRHKVPEISFKPSNAKWIYLWIHRHTHTHPRVLCVLKFMCESINGYDPFR